MQKAASRIIKRSLAMKRNKIMSIPTNSTITIQGITFNGLKQVKEAVEVIMRIETNLSGKRFFGEKEPKARIQDIHVAELFEPYPCFDSSDWEFEDRDTCIFCFSKKPFTEEELNRIASYRHIQSLPIDALPALYYCGQGDIMILATED